MSTNLDGDSSFRSVSKDGKNLIPAVHGHEDKILTLVTKERAQECIPIKAELRVPLTGRDPVFCFADNGEPPRFSISFMLFK